MKRYRQFIIVIFLTLLCKAGFAESVSSIVEEGEFSTSRQCNLSFIITAQVVNNYEDESKLTLIINDTALKTFYKNSINKQFVVWGEKEQLVVNNGDHHCIGEMPVNWLRETKINIIAWEEDARELPVYIDELKMGLNQAIAIHSVAKGKKHLQEAKVLLSILLERLDYINEQLANGAEHTKAIHSKLEELNAETSACEKIIAENRKFEKEHQKQIETYTLEITAIKDLIAELNRQRPRPDDDIRRLEATRNKVEKKLQQEVVIIEKLHEESYECDDVINANIKKITSLESESADHETKMVNLTNEKPLREEDINQVRKVITQGNGFNTTTQSSDSETTIVYHEEDDKRSTGEIFGIACIPALGIGLPVSIAAGMAYTEWRRDDSDKPEEAAENNEKPQSEPEKNNVIIRNLDQGKQQLRE